MKKILLVTGASSDLGIEFVKQVYGNYKLIYLQYRTENDKFRNLIECIGNQTEVVLLKADFLCDGAAQQVITQIREKKIIPNHIVHFPAPKAYNKQFHKDSWENYELGWQISVRSIVEILQSFLPDMSKERYGRVIFVLTSYTLNNPPKFQSSYVTVKYALLGLMKALAAEYAEKGITVNGISPDMVETKFLSDIPQLIVEQNAEKNPRKRNLFPNEIIPMMEYLLSDLCAAITGQNIGITGGR